MAGLWSLCPALLLLLCNGVIASPLQLDATQTVLNLDRTGTTARRKLHGRFLHITDLHPDLFYKLHSSTAEEDACHRGLGPAGTYGAETSDCDAPSSLINATMAWIKENLRDQVDFVIWTGDNARHDSDELIPRSPAQVLGTNRWIADSLADVFADPTGKGLSVPVVPTLGNNDILPHNILLPGPNRWLQQYTDIWRHFIPEEQRHSFQFGGWFYVEVIPNKLAVFSLNTLYFFDRNAGVDDCLAPSEPGFKQMEWLRVQLGFMRRRGVKAILMGHVPPARTESKRLWDETCWQKYALWLKQYRDVVVGGVYGHMNIDHFLLQDTKEIDLKFLLGKGATPADNRGAMEDELSVQGTADYLQELRDGWSKLPRPILYASSETELESTKKKKKKKKKKGGGKKKKSKDHWAERYQLSLISPSIVPNFFPTLRVIEYNVSGLDAVPVWRDAQHTIPPPYVEDGKGEPELGLAHDDADEQSKKSGHKEGHKRKNKKNKKPKKPRDPNLHIPDAPAKTAPPGPAYSAQSLTFTGYTQYYANLTHINNDMTPDDPHEPVSERILWLQQSIDWLQRWRRGKHGDKEPKDPHHPKPRKFEFEVEYSTFDDKIYNLTDLTVNSFVELAYRMGKTADGKDVSLHEHEQEGSGTRDHHSKAESNDDNEMSSEEEDLSDAVDKKGTAETEKGKGGKNKKGKKHKKKKKTRKNERTWLHFLRHAFVSTLDTDELRKLYEDRRSRT